MSNGMLLPQARTPDPHAAPAIRWGILAPGKIARTFADAVAIGTASTVVAVGSRSAERARAFADEFGIERAHGSYEELVADAGIDAVYVASPHSEHHDHALLALDAGKPVLVEKAFTRNASEARAIIDTAAAAGLLVAEAMWSRYLPHYDVVRQVVESGLIGDVTTVLAEHGQHLYPHGPTRLAQPELAGGALLDLGVYPVSFADLVLGGPSALTATATLTDLGVDATTSIVMTTDRGAHAVLSCSMVGASPCTASVVGTQGRLDIAGTFYSPSTIRLINERKQLSDERPGLLESEVRGFSYEAAEFARCLADGRLETESVPHATSLRVMETLEEVRRQIGLVYPGE